MIETGLYSVDVWVDFENVDESGCVLASAADVHDESLLAPGKVVVAFDDDHVALALVVGRVRQGSATRVPTRSGPGGDRRVRRGGGARSRRPVWRLTYLRPHRSPRGRGPHLGGRGGSGMRPVGPRSR